MPKKLMLLVLSKNYLLLNNSVKIIIYLLYNKYLTENYLFSDK